MTLNLTIPQSTPSEFAARVVGVGAGGSAVVNYMIASKLKGVEFFIADTDGLKAGLKLEAVKREAEQCLDVARRLVACTTEPRDPESYCRSYALTVLTQAARPMAPAISQAQIGQGK